MQDTRPVSSGTKIKDGKQNDVWHDMMFTLYEEIRGNFGEKLMNNLYVFFVYLLH